ncbi:MAG: TIGR00730 family Rossman fold protein [Roseibacillus sp.]
MKLNSVAVYCGSSPGSLPIYESSAYQFGQQIAEQGLRLVYGGGNVGLMGAVADGALSRNGVVVGVIPRKLVEKEVSHLGLTELIEVESMHERKMKMADLSDAFVALPGGIGTLEEILEVMTWTQLGFHEKPCGLLDISNYYSSLISFFKNVVEQRFMKADHLDALLVEVDGRELLQKFRNYEHVAVEKWIDRESKDSN